MFWWILLGLCILATLVAAVLKSTTYADWPDVVLVIAIPVAAILAILCISSTIAVNNNISVFNQHKAYIELHEPSNEIEDAALTTKKIELNDWLYSAQYRKSAFGFFSFVSDEVMDMKPIE